jgi:hypothetical protein
MIGNEPERAERGRVPVKRGSSTGATGDAGATTGAVMGVTVARVPGSGLSAAVSGSSIGTAADRNARGGSSIAFGTNVAGAGATTFNRGACETNDIAVST